MAFNSLETIPFENRIHDDSEVSASFEESAESFRVQDGSDTDDGHKVFDEAFDEMDDDELQTDQLKEYHANEQELINLKKNEKKTGLAFLKRKWTIPELLTTCALFFEVFGWGLFHGILGPTLLDIEQLTGTTTAEVALMFTALTVGALAVGAPLGGYLLDKYNCRLYLALVLFCFGIMTTLVPVASNFVELIIISVILGVFAGALDCGQNVTALLIWGWDGAILMQGFHCVFALGTFVAPWLAAPFISPDLKILNETMTVSFTSSQNDNSTASPVFMELKEANIASTVKLETDTANDNYESDVQFTFLIVGGYSIVSSGFFVVSYISHRKYTKTNETNISKSKNKGVTSEKRSSLKHKEPKWFLFSMLVLMFLRFAFYVGLDIMSASFLMTFAVKGLGWTKPQGIAVTSCFRGVYSVGRGTSVILALLMSPTKMILMDLFLILTGLLVLTIFINFHELILWIFISLVGFGMGSFYGASMSWADKYMNVTGKTGSVFITGSWFGLLSLPALTGYLFDKVSPYWYIYACFGDALAVALVTFLAMALVYHYHKKHLGKTFGLENNNMVSETQDHTSFVDFKPEENANGSVKSFQIIS